MSQHVCSSKIFWTCTFKFKSPSNRVNRHFPHFHSLLEQNEGIMGKRQKKLKKPIAPDGQDRISNLPDVLLTHILSFICTRNAVRTSVLSTRWRPLWAYVPRLDLSDSEFLPKGDALVVRDKRKANFLTFVDRFLMQNNRSCVRKLYLECAECYDFSLIESWICAVKSPYLEGLLLHIKTDFPSEHPMPYLYLSYNCPESCLLQHPRLPTLKIWLGGSYSNDPSILGSLLSLCKELNVVEELELRSNTRLNWHDTNKFPERSFTWEMLVVLKLRYCVDLDCPQDTICFPKLKVLHVHRCTFKDDDSASHLINSSCPVLEELVIVRFDDLSYMVITSHTLKRLSVDSRIPNLDKFPLETLIDVPALEYLDLQDPSTTKFILGDFRSIIEARVAVKTQCAAEFLRKIHNVHKLRLYDDIWALEGTKTFDLTAFHYLTHLDFRRANNTNGIELPLILEFLSRSPKLEYLHFQGINFVAGEEFDLTLEHDVPKCLLSSLKTCTFELRDGGETEIEVIRYFLKNSKVLECMTLVSWYWVCINKEAISALPRGSSQCKIDYR